jgi:hypothetical protein
MEVVIFNLLLYLCLDFRRHSGGVRNDFTEKGVIEIIFMDNKADIVPTPLFLYLYKRPNGGSREAQV